MMNSPMMNTPMQNTPMMHQPMMGQVAPMMQPAQMGATGGPGWMPQPTSGIAGVPSGLEYLSKLSGMVIHQQHDFMEMFSDIENPNVYMMVSNIYESTENDLNCPKTP